MLIIDAKTPTGCVNCELAEGGYACKMASRIKGVLACPIKAEIQDGALFEVKHGKVYTARFHVPAHNELNLKTGETRFVDEHIEGGKQLTAPPVDVQVIVRCADCRYYDRGTCLSPKTNYTELRSANWFCADGKVRPENDTEQGA